MMNLQEFQNKLMELFDGGSANENKVNMDNFVSYVQEIKKQEPTENIIAILDNPKNKENIYMDYEQSMDRIYFSQFFENDSNGKIGVNFIMPFAQVYLQTNLHLKIQNDGYEDEEEFLESEWPYKYILFDEKVFNQFMYPHKNPEFLNWKSSPWRLKQ